MKGFLFLVLALAFCLILNAQIHEPEQRDMSQERYMTMLIDSLQIAESEQDTFNLIRYASVLVTEFQRIRIRKEAVKYLNIALQYASASSQRNLYYEVCNRAGMLVYSFKQNDLSDSISVDEYLHWCDSSLVWHQRVVQAKESTPGAKGWAYRAMMQVVFTIYLQTKDPHLINEVDELYEQGMKLSENIDDPELPFYLMNRYSTFLNFTNQLDRAAEILTAMGNDPHKQRPAVMSSYFFNLATNIALKNDLDTIVTLYKLQNHARLKKDVTALNKEVLNADKKYEVTKTKGILEDAEVELAQSKSRMLLMGVGTLIFLMAMLYFFQLNKKNKKLSQRNEILLKEQNHRVKNNLQMISSLLSLQSQKLISTDAKVALYESQGRINSVALLHRMLYEGKELGVVDIKNYLDTLIKEISYTSPRKMTMNLNVVQHVEISIEKATSLGLIVNELVTNSLKHVEEHIDLKIGLSITREQEEISIDYRDNGNGFDPETWHTSNSFGHQLIHLQSEQLRGRFEVISRPGFQYSLQVTS
ncbi:MAG: sensor histidine kinase [Cytophagales bacterium]|nr:sensor histidine kinase [Cytophagales bacterium]